MTELVRSRAYDSTVWLYRLTFLPAWKLFGVGHRKWLLDRLIDLGARDVLDAGTGTGWWAGVIARARPATAVVGLDFSPRYLDAARRSLAGLANVSLLEADLAATGLPPASFDAIVCSRVLDTLPDRRAAFAELRRLLRPRGELILFLKGSARWPDRLLKSCFKLVTRGDGGLWNPVRVEDELDALSAEAGLRVVALDRHRFTTRIALTPTETP